MSNRLGLYYWLGCGLGRLFLEHLASAQGAGQNYQYTSASNGINHKTFSLELKNIEETHVPSHKPKGLTGHAKIKWASGRMMFIAGCLQGRVCYCKSRR